MKEQQRKRKGKEKMAHYLYENKMLPASVAKANLLMGDLDLVAHYKSLSERKRAKKNYTEIAMLKDRIQSAPLRAHLIAHAVYYLLL